ncbi:nucleotidyltransferase domain-containing protein [Marinobacteraceae bacterium S3BR75-40.1]
MSKKKRSAPTEKELIEGLDAHSVHADELAELQEREWPDANPGFPDREKQPPSQDREPLDRLRGSVVQHKNPTEPVWEDGDSPSLDLLREFLIPILDLVRHYKCHNARVIGSVARGTATSTSDVDLLVDADSDATLLDIGGLKEDLEDLFGYPVGIVTSGDRMSFEEKEKLRIEAISLEDLGKSGFRD